MIYLTFLDIPLVGLFIIISYVLLFWMKMHGYYLKYQLYSKYYRN